MSDGIRFTRLETRAIDPERTLNEWVVAAQTRQSDNRITIAYLRGALNRMERRNEAFQLDELDIRDFREETDKARFWRSK